jgi:hypothetical protein
MKDRIMKFRRQRWCKLVVRLGSFEDRLRRARAELDREYQAGEAAALDVHIERLYRRRMRLLDKLKETA